MDEGAIDKRLDIRKGGEWQIYDPWGTLSRGSRFSVAVLLCFMSASAGTYNISDEQADSFVFVVQRDATMRAKL